MKAAFMKICGAGVCEGALKTVVQALNGGDLDTTDALGCDLGEMIYEGAPTMATPLYRGHRDLGLMMFAGAYNYAMTGFIVQSAFLTLN